MDNQLTDAVRQLKITAPPVDFSDLTSEDEFDPQEQVRATEHLRAASQGSSRDHSLQDEATDLKKPENPASGSTTADYTENSHSSDHNLGANYSKQGDYTQNSSSSSLNFGQEDETDAPNDPQPSQPVSPESSSQSTHSSHNPPARSIDTNLRPQSEASPQKSVTPRNLSSESPSLSKSQLYQSSPSRSPRNSEQANTSREPSYKLSRKSSLSKEGEAKEKGEHDRSHSIEHSLPLDHIDLFLHDSPYYASSKVRRSGSGARSPSPAASNYHTRPGLLSFNSSTGNQTPRNRHRDDSQFDSDESDDLADTRSPFGQYGNKSMNGVRRKQTLAHKLETENMELRLKLQQYREMNASEQEIARAKYQLARSENRIDELERALERKNQTISELCEQRDAAMQQVQSEKTAELIDTINDLQTAITQLEEEAQEAEKTEASAIAQLREDMPEALGSHQRVGIEELVALVRQQAEENGKLTSLASTASSLRAQMASLKESLSKSGYPGDPLVSLQTILSELNAERSTAAESYEASTKEQTKLKRELESLRQNSNRRIQELEDHSMTLQNTASNQALLIQDLEAKIVDLQKLLTDSRATSYTIVRSFFAELFDTLGADFQETVEKQLAEIMEKARSEGLSKIPMLTQLLVDYTHKIGESLVKQQSNPQLNRKIGALELEIQSLEHILEMKWDKAGADSVLRAQVRDLKKQLKLEEEKRKSEWLEYQYYLQQARKA